MANIELIITDKRDTAVQSVQAIIRCEYKNKDSWHSEVLLADLNGIIRLEIENTLIRRFNWQTLRLDLRRQQEKLSYSISEQGKVAPGRYRVRVVVDDAKSDIDGPTTEDDNPVQPPRPNRYALKNGFSVNGVVSTDDGRPLSNLPICAFDKGIGKEKELGKTFSDDSGRYHIAYKKEGLLNPSSGTANLVVRVYASAAARTPLAVSPMKQNARRREVIDLTVDSSDYQGPALVDIVAGKLESLQLDTESTTLDMNDVRLIARRTDQTVEVVMHFLLAQIFARRAEVLAGKAFPVAPVFGILHAGLTPDGFAAARDSRLVNLLKQAIGNNWIQTLDAQKSVDAMRPVRVKLLAQSAARAVAMIRKKGLDDKQVAVILDAYLRSDQSLYSLLHRLGEQGQIPAQTAQAVQGNLALGQFMGGRLDVADALATDHGIAHPMDLSRLTSKDWRTIVQKHFAAMADDKTDETKKEKINRLTDDMNRQVEAAFPTAVFSQQWKADGGMGNNALQSYLEKHPAFDFSRQRLEQYWEEVGKPPAAKTRSQLQRVERLFHIAPDHQRFPAFKALWAAGIDSARNVLDQGRGRFVDSMVGAGVDALRANEIFRKARRVASRDLLAIPPVPVGKGERQNDDENTAPVRVQPTIAALFGGQGGNGCPHCLSAFSPAAYLLDMLGFLKKAQTDTGANGLDLFFIRRPDVANLRLDCPNTDTVMPYIDLVNEILEHVVGDQRRSI